MAIEVQGIQTQHNKLFLSFNQGNKWGTQFTHTLLSSKPVSEDGPQLSSQTHLQHHVQILRTAKGFVQPGPNMNILYCKLPKIQYPLFAHYFEAKVEDGISSICLVHTPLPPLLFHRRTVLNVYYGKSGTLILILSQEALKQLASPASHSRHTHISSRSQCEWQNSLRWPANEATVIFCVYVSTNTIHDSDKPKAH